MKQTSIDLIDDSYACYFSIDCRDEQAYTIRKRTGILSRSFNGEWHGSSEEASSLRDAAKHLNRKIKPSTLDQDIDTVFIPAKLLKNCRVLLDYLQSLNEEWKIIFRTNRTRRFIFGKSSTGNTSIFDYYSIQVKIQLKETGTSIEVSEGSVREAKFNQDGLISRIKDLISNHTEKKSVTFQDKVPVILCAGDGGIMMHEILGHTLEADYIHQGESPISLKDIGKRIMPDNVTISTADKYDAFFKGIDCDDEGETPRSPLLIDKGILKNIIADNVYKNLLDIKSAGHCRVSDFTRLPMPRMYALYLQPGPYHPEELINATKYGVYAQEFGEGKINFDKNLFYFKIRDGRLIENGKRTIPLGEIVVRGDIMEVLNSIQMVASDFRYDKGSSYCFKKGQPLNVRVGQPTIKINNLWITKEYDE